MKHLRKKYIKSVQVGQDVVDVLQNASIDEAVIDKIKQNQFADYFGIVQTNGNELIQTFKFIESDKFYFIPEPDPIVIYFDTARHFFKAIHPARLNLFKELNDQPANAHKITNQFNGYFANASAFVIFIFLAMEALINKIIPVEFEYRKSIQDKKTELFDKFQIQRNIEFIEKIKDVLPLAVNKSFHVEHSHKFDIIRNIKSFRDEIVHTKSKQKTDVPNYYESLYVTSLNFDYEKALYVAKDFINYYQENLIEECDCGRPD